MSIFYTQDLDNIFSIRFWLFLSFFLVIIHLMLLASVFPQERFTPSKTDIELTKNKIYQYDIKKIHQKTND